MYKKHNRLIHAKAMMLSKTEKKKNNAVITTIALTNTNCCG